MTHLIIGFFCFILVDRNPWSDAEKDAVKRTLGKFFVGMKVPGKKAIDQAILKEPILQKRPWLVIKSYVYNVIERRKKKMKSGMN